MAKPITNADLFFVIFVAGYIFKWWINALQIVAASFSGPMQSDAAAVAEIACAGLIAMTARHSD
jgi:hypothetical protein